MVALLQAVRMRLCTRLLPVLMAFTLSACAGDRDPAGPGPEHDGVRWSSIAVGGAHACGVLEDSRGYCWGKDIDGVLGTGAAGGVRLRPTEVAGGHRWSVIATGTRSTCGLTLEGAAYCWGSAAFGALGDGRPGNDGIFSATPVAVLGGHRFSDITVGWHFACGLTEDGRAFCWGSDIGGRLATEPIPDTLCTTTFDGMKPCAPAPVASAAALRFRSIEANSYGVCGLTLQSEAYCWGSNGDLGLATDTIRGCATWYVACSHTPVRIPLPGPVDRVEPGGFSVCALVAGAAYCWGGGPDALGIGKGHAGQRCPSGLGFCRATPTAVVGGGLFRSIAGGRVGYCAIDAAGRSHCWGKTPGGAISSVPVPAAWSVTFQQLSLSHGVPIACGLTADGAAYCWGDLDGIIELPPGADPSRPVPVPAPAAST